MSFKLLSSPLQGFTDFRFRNAFDKYFGGIDTFYAPYIRLNGKMLIKPVYERDLKPSNNSVKELIPQVMTNDADEFLFVSEYIQDLGYKELNWNLGCPYPMVTNRGMGSGLICDIDKIDKILEKVHSKSDVLVSMKMRLGYENPDEILKALPILEKYPIKNIAVHARIGKQLYKGSVDHESFNQALKKSKIKIYYNGDITSIESFKNVQEKFLGIDHWMIGRGLITNPFLPSLIKNNQNNYPENRLEIFSKFHDTLFNDYESALSGKSHVLNKMTSYWEYFSNSFSNPHKTFKKIKKAKSIQAYHEATKWIFDTEHEHNKLNS